ncbi:UMP kinase [Candidatus Woesearchaeota archaeon]|nr:UMP kinase [Candidatus Woesearchaeota archaeon]
MALVKVISLGGSVINPGQIDVEFLKGFRKLLVGHSDMKFAIVCGGGRVCRSYQAAAREAGCADDKSLDWIGVAATRLNAQLLHAVLRDVAYPEVVVGGKAPGLSSHVVVAAGVKPGQSTDQVAVQLAKGYKSDCVINVTARDFVYDKNPDKFRDAKPVKSISWKDFRQMFPKSWSPGMNIPFDPVASREAEKAGMNVIVVGKSLENLGKVLEKRKFSGTVVG